MRTHATPVARFTTFRWAVAIAVLATALVFGVFSEAPNPALAAGTPASISVASVTPDVVSQPTAVKTTSVAAASFSTVVSTPKRTVATVTQCGGSVIKTKNLYKPGTHTRVAELVAYYSKLKYGTLCAVLNLLGKYRGLPKSMRRFSGVYLCRGHDHCNTGTQVHASDYGFYGYQAGPRKLTHVNGYRMYMFGFSDPHNGVFTDEAPFAHINTKGGKVIR